MEYILLVSGVVLVFLAGWGFVKERRKKIEPIPWLHLLNLIVGLGAVTYAVFRLFLWK
ncbi:MAG: hypothetical protein PWQ91_145 [Eubacteriales bacterium]|nr:hypothetical protein [Eubacteriales bacterium]MDN5363084.1 hypothetical protein [Eubacteriales bacterium]